MRKITQTIVGTTPPLDKNVLWLDTTNSNSPVEKVFLNGEWIPTSAASGEYYTKDEVDENFMGKIDDPHVGNILVMDENGKAVDSLTKPANFISNPEGGQEHAVLSLDSHGNPVWTPLTPGGDVIESEMKDDSDKAVQNGVIKKYVDNNCARKDGYYSQMTVGSAENLVGQTVDSEAYLIRPTGGAENEVANAVASVLGMEGNSCLWNQHSVTSGEGANDSISERSVILNGTTDEQIIRSYRGNVTKGHIFFIYFDIKASESITCSLTISDNLMSSRGGVTVDTNYKRIYAISTITRNTGIPTSGIKLTPTTETTATIYTKNCMRFDLTLLGIDNLTTVADVEAWLAQHVGTKPYYAYNAGTILSAQTLGIKTYGQNLLNPTTRQARLIPYEWEDNSNVYTIKNIPSGATATFTPDATGVAESITITNNEFDITSYGSGILELSAATADTYVCMKWDEDKDDDVVPYEDHTYDFDVRKVYGKVNGAGEYVQCFPNGLKGIGSVKDTLTASEAVVRIGSVDLGTLNWTYSEQYSLFTVPRSQITNLPLTTNAMCSLYIYGGAAINKSFYISNSNLVVVDSSYTDATTFQTAMSGVMLNYELATPITYTDLVYRDGGIDRPLTDVLMNIEVNNWSIEEQMLTPYVDGNPTSVPAKISTQYGMDAVEEIYTIKHTYVSAYSEQNFSDSQKAQARRNIGAVEEDGTYPNMSVGIAKNLAGENAVEAEYTYRQSGGTTGTDTGIANVTAVKGKTLKWQQLISTSNIPATTTQDGITFTNNGDGSVSVSGTASADTYITIDKRNHIPVGHKGLFLCGFTGGSISTYYVTVNISNYNQIVSKGCVATTETSSNWRIRLQVVSGANVSFKFTPMLFDLTEMGLDSITSVEEFEALYPLDYYAYTPTPVLINNAASGIVTTGFNQWDGVLESGYYDTTDGSAKSASNWKRSKNAIKVFPDTNYYIKVAPIPGSSFGYLLYYDASMNYLGSSASDASQANAIYKTPSGCRYMHFYCAAIYTTEDICINLSDTAKNGTYEPYEKHTFYFDKVLQSEGSLATIKGKLNGEGESVVVFPDGLKRVGNVFDEIKGNVAIKRIGSVDLGTLDYSGSTNTSTNQERYQTTIVGLKSGSEGLKGNIICTKFDTITSIASMTGIEPQGIFTYTNNRVFVLLNSITYNTADAFKTAMNGVLLYYELAEPETYILDQTVTGGYQVNANGTERRLPEDTASAVNAPVNYSVIYPIDAVGTITKLPINYISEKSLTNFTTELASKLGTFLNAMIGISATYNQTTQEYDYSITITSNE